MTRVGCWIYHCQKQIAAKLVLDVKLNKLFGWSKEEVKEKLNADQLKNAEELINKLEEEGLEGEVIRQAKLIEVRLEIQESMPVESLSPHPTFETLSGCFSQGF